MGRIVYGPAKARGQPRGAKSKDFCPLSAIMALITSSLVYSITPDRDLCQLKGTLIANLISYNWISISMVNSQLRNFLIHVYIAGKAYVWKVCACKLQGCQKSIWTRYQKLFYQMREQSFNNCYNHFVSVLKRSKNGMHCLVYKEMKK